MLLSSFFPYPDLADPAAAAVILSKDGLVDSETGEAVTEAKVPREINELPRRDYDATADEKYGPDCAICFDPLSDKDLRIMKCPHLLHAVRNGSACSVNTNSLLRNAWTSTLHGKCPRKSHSAAPFAVPILSPELHREVALPA